MDDSNNIIQEMGIKDLEHVVLKAKETMKLGNKTFKAGEPVLYFQNIQIALLSEDTRVVAAQGGFLNQPRVVWEDRSNTVFQFSNGTLNPISLNLLLEANVITSKPTYVPYQEFIMSECVTKEGEITEKEKDGTEVIKVILSFNLKHKAAPKSEKKSFYYTFALENLQHYLTVMDMSSFVNQITREENTKVTVKCLKSSWEKIENLGGGIMADYYFYPKKNPIIYSMDRERKPNLYTLEATFYLKDENDGLLHTGILEMPKVYIMSNINLRMGERADPSVGTFRIMAMPDDYDNYDSMVWRMMYLEDDIYSI